MKELKEKLIEIEKEFIDLKKQIERCHLLILLIVLGIPVISILIMNKYFPQYFTTAIKAGFFSIIFIGLLLHFFIRNRYHKNNSGFNKYIKKKITSLKNDLSLGKDYKEEIVKTSSEILQSKGISLTNDNMHNHPFWELLIKNLNN